jgi:hypothetical protein
MRGFFFSVALLQTSMQSRNLESFQYLCWRLGEQVGLAAESLCLECRFALNRQGKKLGICNVLSKSHAALKRQDRWMQSACTSLALTDYAVVPKKNAPAETGAS